MNDTARQISSWHRYIPNALTVLRMILIVPMAFSFLEGNRLLSLIFFLLAGLSDLLDGFLARRLNAISDFGKTMDPVADKLTLLTIVACLFRVGDLPLIIIVVIFAKELLMILGGVIMYRNKIVASSNMVGKIGTLLFTLAIVLAFLKAYTNPWYLYTMYTAVAFSIFSFAQYAVSAIKTFRARPSQG